MNTFEALSVITVAIAVIGAVPWLFRKAQGKKSGCCGGTSSCCEGSSKEQAS